MFKSCYPLFCKLALFLLLTFSCANLALAGDIKPDVEVVIFPPAAYMLDGSLHIPIHGWVFEKDDSSVFHGVALSVFTKTIGLPKDSTQNEIYRRRAGAFLVDNERGKYLDLEMAGQKIRVGPTKPNGHFETELVLDNASQLDLSLRVIFPVGDERVLGENIIRPMSKGASIISDIDDTIKISQVTDKELLVENTFLKPFKTVPVMADVYARWFEEGVTFHWVSSSPYQLYPILDEFMDAAGFPPGSFHLKHIRAKDKTVFNLLASSEKTKPPQIKELLSIYPERDFILIGDAGKHDPEVYGDIARAFPTRIRHIYIRKVANEQRNSERFKSAFSGLPNTLWDLIPDGEDLPEEP